MNQLINAFIAEQIHNPMNTEPSDWFYGTVKELNVNTDTNLANRKNDIRYLWTKLRIQWSITSENLFLARTLTPSSIEAYHKYKESNRHNALYLTLSHAPQKQLEEPFINILDSHWDL